MVKVELHSARTGKVSEIGRLLISNDGTGSPTRGNYVIQRLRRGTQAVQKTGRVEDYPRQSYSVWELLKRALKAVC